jgi:hypothetical protein
MKSLKHTVRKNISLWSISTSYYDYGCDRIVRPVQFPILIVINAILNNTHEIIRIK